MVSPVRAVARAMRAQRRELAVAALLGSIASLSAVAILGTSGWLISRAAEAPPVLFLTVAAVLVRTFALSRAVFRYAERLVGHDAAFRGLTGLRVSVYQSLERIGPIGIAGYARGDLLNRLVADVDAALDLPLRVVLPWVQAILVSAATVLFLAFLLPGAGMVVGLLAVVAVAAVPWVAARTARSAEERIAPAKGEVATAVVQILDSTPELAAFGAAGRATGRVRDLDARLTALSNRESFALGFGGGLGTVVQGAAVAVSLGLGVVAVTEGRLEPVWLAVAALLPLALFDVIGGLPSSALAYQRLASSATRIVDLESTPTPVAVPEHPTPLPAEFSGLALENVTADWPAAVGRVSTPMLTGISLRIEPGERVAIVGPSGAGKSTLAAVIMGFLSYGGSLRLSGVEVREALDDDLRTHIGLLSQQAHLFSTTIADNLRLANPQASDAELLEAMDAAQLTAWVERLPLGMDTDVGVLGFAVSGGERQRLALARLLLARVRLVILDEPTEHIDAATAGSLVATMSAALAATTTLLITHRLTEIGVVDHIIELQDGRIVAEGTHPELMALEGWYAKQWQAESDLLGMALYVPTLPVGLAVAGPAA